MCRRCHRNCPDDDEHSPEPGPSGIDPPSSVDVDLPENEPMILYGPDGDVLMELRPSFGFAAWRDR